MKMLRIRQKALLRRSTTALFSLLIANVSLAGDPGRVTLELLWLRAGDVDFGGIGYLGAATDPGPVSGPADRFYDNGYVRVDSSGNSEGLTWYWGLDDNQGYAPESIDLYSFRSEASKSVTKSGDPDAPGISLNYIKPLRSKGNTRLLLVAGLRFARFDFNDDANLVGSASVLKDSYYTSGIVLPQAPYSGGFDGPGPLIDSEPFRRQVTVSSFTSETIGSRSLSGDLMALRLGLGFERALSERTFLSLQIGYEALSVDGTFRYSETTTIPELNYSGTSGGKRSHKMTDGGAFLSAHLTRDLTERLTLEMSLGMSDHETYAIEEGPSRVTWDLAELVDFGIGIGYRF
jgi:hypothetical protein